MWNTHWNLISRNLQHFMDYFLLYVRLLAKVVWLSSSVDRQRHLRIIYFVSVSYNTPARCPRLSFTSSAQTWRRARKNKRTIIIFSRITSSRCQSPHVEADNCCLQISGGTILPEDVSVGVCVRDVLHRIWLWADLSHLSHICTGSTSSAVHLNGEEC